MFRNPEFRGNNENKERSGIVRYIDNNENIESTILFQKFCKEILNYNCKNEEDNQDKNKYLFSDNSKKNNNIQLFKTKIEDLNKDGSPVILAKSTENNDNLIIINASNSITRIFGYNKEDLINKEVGILIPKIFYQTHKNLIKNHINNNITVKRIKQKTIRHFGLHKNGFLISIKANLYLLPTLKREQIYCIKLNNVEKINNFVGFCIINQNLEMVNITSQCLKLFNFTNKAVYYLQNYRKLKDERINLKNLIQELSPNLINLREPTEKNTNNVNEHRISNNNLNNYNNNNYNNNNNNNNNSTISDSNNLHHIKPYIEHKDTLIHLYNYEQLSNLYSDSFVESDNSLNIVKKVTKNNNNKNNDNNSNNNNSNKNSSNNSNNENIDTSSFVSSKNKENLSQENNNNNNNINNSNNINENNDNKNAYNLKKTSNIHHTIDTLPVIINISQIFFGNNLTNYLCVKLEYNLYSKINKMHSNKSLLSMNNNLTNSKKNFINFKYKFYKNKIIFFDGKNFNYLIDKKENENLYNFQIKKKKGKSRKNINFNLSPSNSNHLTFNNIDSKDKKENFSNSLINENNNIYDQNKSSIIEENLENYYTVLNFKNYGIGVNYFELDYTNLQISIFPKNCPKLFPNLNDIKYFFDEDTQKNDEEITNLDDNDDYLDKSKCEINKYKIFKKELKNKKNCIFDLFLLSNSSLIVHIIMSIILLMKYLQYIKQAKNGILGIFYIIKLLNFTMASSNFFIDSQYYKNFNSIENEIKYEIFDNISIILQNNSVYMYDILSFKNIILTDLMNEINKTIENDNNIELGYLTDINSTTLEMSIEKKYNSYIESNNQLMAIIYMISLTIGEDDFNLINSFFLYYNSINDYFLHSYQIIMNINGLVSNYYPIFYQILIIVLGLFLDIFLFVLMNFLINSIQNKINEISLEFLNIKPLEYKFIYKVANDFYKKIKINYNNEEEDFEDDNTEMINKKSIEKKRNNKFLLNQKFNKIRLIGKIKNVAILSFFLLIFGLYYLILYLYIKNNLFILNFINNLYN